MHLSAIQEFDDRELLDIALTFFWSHTKTTFIWWEKLNILKWSLDNMLKKGEGM